MNGKLLELVRNWWFLVIFVAGIGAWGSSVKSDIQFMVHEVEEQRIMIKELIETQGELSESTTKFMAGSAEWMRLHAEHHKMLEARIRQIQMRCSYGKLSP